MSLSFYTSVQHPPDGIRDSLIVSIIIDGEHEAIHTHIHTHTHTKHRVKVQEGDFVACCRFDDENILNIPVVLS